MPTAAVQYSADFKLPDLLQRDQGGTLSCPVYLADALVAPTQAGSTVSVYRPDGTALVSAAAVTVASSIATYAVSAASLTSEPLSMGYRVEWSLLLSGATRTFRNTLGVVRAVPAMAARDGSLVARHLQLDRHLAGTGQSHWGTQLEEAWVQLNRWLIKQGSRAHLVVEPSELLDLHCLWTLELIFTFLADGEEVGGRFRTLLEDYRAKLEQEKKSASFTYDTADDGRADTRRRPARAATFLGTHGLDNLSWLDRDR